MKKKLWILTRASLLIAVLLIIINIIPLNDSIPLNGLKKENSDKLKLAMESSIADMPPNVLISFTKAASLGIRVFKISVYSTLDNILVISDTNDLSSITESSGAIEKIKHEDLKALNFAFNYQNSIGAYPYRDNPIQCLTVDELFECFPYSDYIIELKTKDKSLEEVVLILSELVRKHNLSNRVALQGSKNIRSIIRNNKEIVNVSFIQAGDTIDLDRYSIFQKFFLTYFYGRPNFQYIELTLKEAVSYSKFLFSSLSKRNVSLYLSGISTIESLQKALEYSPDGIFTKEPELIASHVGTDKPPVMKKVLKDKEKKE